MIKNLFKRKEKSGKVVKSAKVIELVNDLIATKALKVKGPVFHIYKDLLIGNKKNIIKNLFFYARLKNLLGDKETLFIKCLEDDVLIAVHNNKDGTVFI